MSDGQLASTAAFPAQIVDLARRREQELALPTSQSPDAGLDTLAVRLATAGWRRDDFVVAPTGRLADAPGVTGSRGRPGDIPPGVPQAPPPMAGLSTSPLRTIRLGTARLPTARRGTRAAVAVPFVAAAWLAVGLSPSDRVATVDGGHPVVDVRIDEISGGALSGAGADATAAAGGAAEAAVPGGPATDLPDTGDTDPAAPGWTSPPGGRAGTGGAAGAATDGGPGAATDGGPGAADSARGAADSDVGSVGPQPVQAPPTEAGGAARVPGMASPSPTTTVPPAVLPSPAAVPARYALPSGTMVFDSEMSGNGEIYTLGIDGNPATLRRLTFDARFDALYARISPDRTQILFHRNPAGGFGNQFELASIWVMDADGSNVRILRPPTTDIGWAIQGHAEWSPDGSQIVFAGASSLITTIQLWLMDPKSGAITDQLTHFGGPSGGGAFDPSYTADGTRVLFAGCASGSCPSSDNQDIYSLELATGEITQHTDNDIAEWDPFMSPDGRQVVWNQQHSLNHWDIWLGGWAPDGLFEHQRTVMADGQENGTTEWAPDGSILYFHRFTLATGRRIYSAQQDGSDLKCITEQDWLYGSSPDLAAVAGS